MPGTMMTIDGFPIPVDVNGPQNGPVIVVLAASQHPLTAYDAVCQRLHTATMRTIVIGADPRLTPKSVVGILDSLGVQCGVLVGDRSGADNAWELAATRPDRFTGLVVLDRGHPRAPDLSGVIRDDRCPAVEINTTVLVSSRATAAVAEASQRFIYGEHRLVVLPGRRTASEFTAQLAMEIVLRASTW